MVGVRVRVTVTVAVKGSAVGSSGGSGVFVAAACKVAATAEAIISCEEISGVGVAAAVNCMGRLQLNTSTPMMNANNASR
jgi:hypothetical protein